MNTALTDLGPRHQPLLSILNTVNEAVRKYMRIISISNSIATTTPANIITKPVLNQTSVTQTFHALQTYLVNTDIPFIKGDR